MQDFIQVGGALQDDTCTFTLCIDAPLSSSVQDISSYKGTEPLT